MSKKRAEILRKFHELESVQKKLLEAKGQESESDPDEYMAAVKGNLDAQLPGIDAYLATASVKQAAPAPPAAPEPPAPTIPLIPESVIGQIITRSRDEMRNVYREEIALDVANEIANEGQRLLENQAEHFEQVQWRLNKFQDEAKRDQQRLVSEMRDLIKGLETFILSRLPNAPAPQPINPPSVSRAAPLPPSVEITTSFFLPNPRAPPYLPTSAKPKDASAGASTLPAPGWHRQPHQCRRRRIIRTRRTPRTCHNTATLSFAVPKSTLSRSMAICRNGLASCLHLMTWSKRTHLCQLATRCVS